jgi:hypothetical protein
MQAQQTITPFRHRQQIRHQPRPTTVRRFAAIESRYSVATVASSVRSFVGDRQIWRVFIAVSSVDYLANANGNRELCAIRKPHQDFLAELGVLVDRQFSYQFAGDFREFQFLFSHVRVLRLIKLCCPLLGDQVKRSPHFKCGRENRNRRLVNLGRGAVPR